MTEHAPVSTKRLGELVAHFYARVRADELIGPVFNTAVDDWPLHLDKLTRFWSSVMLRSGTYSGNPAAEHLKHATTITPEMFDRWLDLWRQSTSELLPEDHASLLQRMAGRIAESLQMAIKFYLGRPTISPPGSRQASAPSGDGGQPYRSTPIFDQDTLPAALRSEHRTKAGTWGVIRVLSGALRLHLPDDGQVQELSQAQPGVVEPEQTHWIEPVGPVRMQVDFHDAPPSL